MGRILGVYTSSGNFFVSVECEVWSDGIAFCDELEIKSRSSLLTPNSSLLTHFTLHVHLGTTPLVRAWVNVNL